MSNKGDFDPEKNGAAAEDAPSVIPSEDTTPVIPSVSEESPSDSTKRGDSSLAPLVQNDNVGAQLQNDTNNVIPSESEKSPAPHQSPAATASPQGEADRVASAKADTPLISPAPAAADSFPLGGSQGQGDVPVSPVIPSESEESPSDSTKRGDSSLAALVQNDNVGAQLQDVNSSAYNGEGTAVPVRTIQEDSASAASAKDGQAAAGAEKSGKRRIRPSSVVAVVLSTLLFLFAVLIFIYAVSARLGNKQVEFFGISFSVVVTDSMTPEIQVGDLVVVKSCDISEVEVGQNAVFISRSVTVDGEAIRIIHRVMEVGEDENGIYLVTQGVKYGTTINNDYVDSDYVRADNFVGVELFHSSVLGNIVTFLSKPQNWILIAVLVAICFFAYKQVRKIVKYAKENKSDKKE